MEADNFLDWFSSTFVAAADHLLRTVPVVLLVDWPSLPPVSLPYESSKGERCASVLPATAHHTHSAAIGC